MTKKPSISLTWANCIVEYNGEHYYSFIDSTKSCDCPISLYNLVTNESVYLEDRKDVTFVAPFHYSEIKSQT